MDHSEVGVLKKNENRASHPGVRITHSSARMKPFFFLQNSDPAVVHKSIFYSDRLFTPINFRNIKNKMECTYEKPSKSAAIAVEKLPAATAKKISRKD